MNQIATKAVLSARFARVTSHSTYKNIILLAIILFLSACAYIDNSQFRNALPVQGLQVAWGPTSSHGVYGMGEYEPENVNNSVHREKQEIKAGQSPLSIDHWLGKKYSIGLDLGFDFGDKFHGKPNDWEFEGYTMNNFSKLHLQKSLALGKDRYLALAQDMGVSFEITRLKVNNRIRSERLSLELPLTYSKVINVKRYDSLIFSIWGRIARDYIASDLSLVGNNDY